MRAEIIAVGSELLLGQITNTNATFISARLAEIGIDVYYHTVVGDNPDRLKKAIGIAEKRADLIVFSGGLGPTKDDLTKETIAEMLGTHLKMNNEALVSIEDYFLRTGRMMTENNKKQALVLADSVVLKNRNGMAPGMALEKSGVSYILLPGPPHELEPMFEREAIPYLLGALGNKEVIVSRVLKFFGIGEAELEHRVQGILQKQSNPTIAPLASQDAVILRITAKALSTDEAEKLIAPVEKEIRDLVGEFIFGINNDTLSSKAADLLKKAQLTIAAAESLTAGQFMSELAGESGISSSLKGGVVVYNDDMKVEQLGVSRSLLKEYGVVSSECAEALARSAKLKFGSDIGVGLTGAAGPDPHDGKPVGTVWIGIALQDGDVKTFKLDLSGTRNTNRRRASQYALYYLIKELKKRIVENKILD
ncbi:competence/damage-inducible protein A [Sporosarcina thermotolerans]|uniref:Putative competence-damage inducible protein n=1 Tax=Sporosarcina thermotolerans TaxID=633404 RepID=A0AAW9A3K7_9BACL|nr:competence/damage-inducible protein A [Sporosarcina thermotolerans]MDW0115666.1 competence/damage-inducible protein A [Sporosarcina thermotolerans]